MNFIYTAASLAISYPTTVSFICKYPFEILNLSWKLTKGIYRTGKYLFYGNEAEEKEEENAKPNPEN